MALNRPVAVIGSAIRHPPRDDGGTCIQLRFADKRFADKRFTVKRIDDMLDFGFEPEGR